MAGSRTRTAAARSPEPAATPTRRLAPILEDDDPPSENYALRLTEALEAIESAETGRPLRPRPATAGNARTGAKSALVEQDARTAGNSFARWLQSLDKLPPIRLPIGPPIPWRLGLPALAAIAVVAVVMSRPAGHADAQATRLPTPEPYAVQQEAPLFTNAQVPVAAPNAPPATSTDQPAQAALGVAESAGLGFDVADIAFKLIAVLALAYGSLLLLKRAGFGGAAVARPGSAPTMRVVSSLTLAPNRSVHVLKVPGGKTLLVGATPNQVNLIADLGAVPEDDSPEATRFFDVLKSKITN